MILCSFCNNTHKLFYHSSYQPSHQRSKMEQCLKHNLCYSIWVSNATPGFAKFDWFQMTFRWEWIAVFTPLLRPVFPYSGDRCLNYSLYLSCSLWFSTVRILRYTTRQTSTFYTMIILVLFCQWPSKACSVSGIMLSFRTSRRTLTNVCKSAVMCLCTMHWRYVW